MGEDINKIEFAPGQDKVFLERVHAETSCLESSLKNADFVFEPNHGYELEGYLVDKDGMPAPRSEDFLVALNDPSFVPEIAKFNWELNGDVFRLSPNLLRQIEADMLAKYSRAQQVAESLGLKTVLIGILPTLRESHLTIENMSPFNRYYALTEQVLKLRQGKKIRVDIDRKDLLNILREDIMTEAAGTSFQIHTQLKQEDLVKAYNIVQIISAPLVAACANSPFFLGKKLWDETRITVFEQAVRVTDVPNQIWLDPVTLGQEFVLSSLIEIYQENQERYPIILPFLFDDSVDELRHLKFLNGQIWRWNRPIVNVAKNKKVNIRLEHRPLPAGPTIPDMVANFALYQGLLQFYLNENIDLTKTFTFDQVKANFYLCAKMGMKANIHWGSLGTINVQKLLHDVLLEQAIIGLKSLGISNEDCDYYMRLIMKMRLRNGFTGAAWQKSFIDTHGADFQAMTLAYHERQNSGQPVYNWKV